ncbi:MAG: D-alanine--D-alanine ligase, partial [Candidatus Mariimomonas ferrooxydans]
MSGRGVMSALRWLGLDCVAIDAAANLEKKLTSEGVKIAFIALHGRWGEDGTVQGLLEFMNIPYTGSGVHASALAMNKVSSKQIFKQAGIPTPHFYVLNTAADLEQEAVKCGRLGYPIIIKPIDEGSSIGCHVSRSRAESVRAIRRERKKYPRLFAEKYIKGKELTVGIVERSGRNIVLPVLELVPKRPFYDYKAKYSEGLTDFIIPARLSPRVTRRVKTLALNVHEGLCCHGVSRTDILIDQKSGRPYVLELNTLPGLTALSDIPPHCLHTTSTITH